MTAKLLYVALLTCVVNFPFGYWRANVSARSVQWFLAIHLPVILVIALRLSAGVRLSLPTFAVLVAFFFVGQYAGKIIFQWRLARESEPLTSCMIWDIVKSIRARVPS